ncbi:MAG: cell division protein SepF [Clostridia bacterium]|nr:cell division protein SepF [Clostridia bacterium]
MAFDFLNRNRSNNQSADSQYDENYYAKQDQDTVDDYGYAAPKQQEPEYDRRETSASSRARLASAGTGASYSMKLMKPSLYTDGPVIAEELLKGNAVIINLENASAEVASNLIFFLDGVVYAIDGHLKAVSATTFMLTPRTMDITEAESGTAQETTEDSGFGYAGYGSGN